MTHHFPPLDWADDEELPVAPDEYPLAAEKDGPPGRPPWLVWPPPRRPELEEYPLAAEPEQRHTYRPRVYPRLDVDALPEAPRAERQFTVREMLGLVTGASLLASVLACLPASWRVGALGLAVLVGLTLRTIFPPHGLLLRLAWWIMLLFYVVAALWAVRFGPGAL